MDKQNKDLMDEISTQFINFSKEKDLSYLNWALENYMSLGMPLNYEESAYFKSILSDMPQRVFRFIGKGFFGLVEKNFRKVGERIER